MAIVTLRPPLRDLAGGREIEIDGATVAELLQALERSHPRLAGWVLDDQGKIRQHIAVFVNEERATPDAPVAGSDRVHVLPSISGGAQDAEVLVGTRKGLFVLRGERGGPMDVAARRFGGQTVGYAVGTVLRFRHARTVRAPRLLHGRSSHRGVGAIGRPEATRRGGRDRRTGLDRASGRRGWGPVGRGCTGRPVP